jgi:hypothetical protein
METADDNLNHSSWKARDKRGGSNGIVVIAEESEAELSIIIRSPAGHAAIDETGAGVLKPSG